MEDDEAADVAAPSSAAVTSAAGGGEREQLPLIEKRLHALGFGERRNRSPNLELLEACGREVLDYLQAVATITAPPASALNDVDDAHDGSSASQLQFGQLPDELASASPLLLAILISSYYQHRLVREEPPATLSVSLADAVKTMLGHAARALPPQQPPAPPPSAEALGEVHRVLEAALFGVHLREETVLNEASLMEVARVRGLAEPQRKVAVDTLCAMVRAEALPFVSLRHAEPLTLEVSHRLFQSCLLYTSPSPRDS